MPPHDPARRRLLLGLAGLALGPAVPAAAEPLHARAIPRTRESIPALGMGTWITFNVAPLTAGRRARVEVLRRFFARGGRLIDSSPMYGLAESAVGWCLGQLGRQAPVFAATKVWVPTRLAGIAQMNNSSRLWQRETFDLMQIHNLLDWEAHLPTLVEWKARGRIRYAGITTSHGRRHDEMERLIRERPEFDFVQFSYSVADRQAEQRLLPAAAERGKAVIVNRPFRTGELFERVAGKPLPPWAAEIGCASWAQFFLKFVISHPAVTCAIPATSRPDHMDDNMQALCGPMPDAAMRTRMAAYFERVAS